jgi:SAM-dependent methyltransferase
MPASPQGHQASEFDRYADEYEAELARGLRLSGEDSSHFARERCRWLRARLERIGVAPGRVLDFGCGTGGAIPYLLAELGAERVLGTDVSPASLAVAEQRHGGAAVRFAAPAQVPAAEFDLVHVNGVFHHIEPAERPAALAAIAAALRPGGLLALWENNPWNPGTRLIMSRVEFDRDAVTLSAPAARRLLAANGFDVLRTDFLFIFPRALAALRRLEPALAALPLGGQYLVLARLGG